MKQASTKEVKEALTELVNKGYLKKTKKGYVDSDRTKSLLMEGKTREQISRILEMEYYENRN